MQNTLNSKLSLVLAVTVTSIFWVMLLLMRLNAKEQQSVAVVTDLFQTIARQKQGWDNSAMASGLLAKSLSGDCQPGSSCYMSIYTEVTKLQTLSDKEKTEIKIMWQKSLTDKDFNAFYESLSDDNKSAVRQYIEATITEPGQKKSGSSLL